MSVIDDAAGRLAGQIKDVSPEIDEEIVKYFYTRVFNKLIFFIGIIPLLILLHLSIISFFILFVSYTLLRRCFGGAHVASDILCLILSIITSIIALWIGGCIKVSIGIIVFAYIFTIIVVKWTGVVDSPNKRIVKLRNKFTQQGYFTIVFLAIITFILFNIDKTKDFSGSIIIGIMMEVISLIIGKILHK